MHGNNHLSPPLPRDSAVITRRLRRPVFSLLAEEEQMHVSAAMQIITDFVCNRNSYSLYQADEDNDIFR
jgi:hypothetical protein